MPGKTGRVDHPSPDCDMLGKLQNVKAFTLLTRIGLKWSGGPIFPAYCLETNIKDSYTLSCCKTKAQKIL